MTARPQTDFESEIQRPKPCVYYTTNELQTINLGARALVFDVLNHPAGLRGRCVMTSLVVALHPGGVFETENTIYLPRH